jgi:hypothetical protein
MTSDEKRTIKVSPVVIQLDIDGYHAGDVRRRVFYRGVLSGGIELHGVSATEIVDSTKLLVFITDGCDAAEVRKEVIKRLYQMIHEDAPKTNGVDIYGQSELILGYQK